MAGDAARLLNSVQHDVAVAIKANLDDFLAMPSHLVFIGLIYPVIGVCLAALTFSNNALPLLFPLAES